MTIQDMAKRDIQQITTDPDGFSFDLLFTAPTGETAAIRGQHSKHHLAKTLEGANVNVRNAHISFSEQLLIDLNYPVRIAGEVKLSEHTVQVKDSTGLDKTYVIREFYPDETVGFILCILGDFE